MAAAAILKITKIAISPQRFDRSLRNLERCCKMALLTVPTVKNFEFHKSKMADGRHFKLQFIHSVNGDGSKTAKIIIKVILLSIPLTFRRCDGG